MKKLLSNRLLMLLAVSAGLIFSSSCNKDDGNDPPANEEELITTVTLTFVNSNNNSSVFKAADPDGPGGSAPEIDNITLEADETYQLFVAFLDESDPNEVKDVTQEVRAEAEEHLVCFSNDVFFAGPEPADTDGNGDPLGLQNSLRTGNAGKGTLEITLKHEPEKGAANPCGTGETDVEVTFPVTIL